MVDLDGNVRGEHIGLMHYTIGQRHGLGIGGTKDTEGEAWFACGKDLENNVLYVCQGFHNEKLYSDSLLASSLSLQRKIHNLINLHVLQNSDIVNQILK